MAGVLQFSEYLGGPDNITIEQIFPSNKRTYQYNFGKDITGWTFEIDYQTLVVDPVSYDRFSGEPNFSNSRVIGSFAKQEVTIDSGVVNVTDALLGKVNITMPSNLYTGPIIPDARSRVPITVVGVTWTTATTPTEKFTHRWAFLMSWEPDVTIGDPTTAAGYTALTVS